MENKIDILLAKYFGGSATKAEFDDLENWISASNENQIEFDRMTSLYEKTGALHNNAPKPDTAIARKVFVAHMNSTKKETGSAKHISFPKHWLFRAASIFIITMISVSVWHAYFSEKEIVVSSLSKPVEKKLSDNTSVILSENSKISYSSKYGKSKRIIQLVGKAAFNVGKAGKGQLRVCAGDLMIEDIGTVFEVTALKDSGFVSVSVSEGQVRFFTANNKGLVIEANQTGIYDKRNKTFEVSEPALKKLSSGIMCVNFNGMPLGRAFDIISKTYHVDIKVQDDEILQRRITVKFEGEDLSMVLGVIAETLNLKVEKNKQAYLFSSKN